MAEREFVAYECDHMRPVVRFDGRWAHISGAQLSSFCEAGIYRVKVTYSGEHYISELVPAPTPGGEKQ